MNRKEIGTHIARAATLFLCLGLQTAHAVLTGFNGALAPGNGVTGLSGITLDLNITVPETSEKKKVPVITDIDGRIPAASIGAIGGNYDADVSHDGSSLGAIEVRDGETRITAGGEGTPPDRISIRGITAGASLAVIDGDYFGDDGSVYAGLGDTPSLVTTRLLQQIETLDGPPKGLYGRTISGAINVITRGEPSGFEFSGGEKDGEFHLEFATDGRPWFFSVIPRENDLTRFDARIEISSGYGATVIDRPFQSTFVRDGFIPSPQFVPMIPGQAWLRRITDYPPANGAGAGFTALMPFEFEAGFLTQPIVPKAAYANLQNFQTGIRADVDPAAFGDLEAKLKIDYEWSIDLKADYSGAYGNSYGIRSSDYFELSQPKSFNFIKPGGISYRFENPELATALQPVMPEYLAVYPQSKSPGFTAHTNLTYSLPADRIGPSFETGPQGLHRNTFGVEGGWQNAMMHPHFEVPADLRQAGRQALTDNPLSSSDIPHSAIRTSDFPRMDILRYRLDPSQPIPDTYPMNAGLRVNAYPGDAVVLHFDSPLDGNGQGSGRLVNEFGILDPSYIDSIDIKDFLLDPNIGIPESALAPGITTQAVGNLGAGRAEHMSMEDYYEALDAYDRFLGSLIGFVHDPARLLGSNPVLRYSEFFEPAQLQRVAAVNPSPAIRLTEPAAAAARLPDDGFFNARGSWGQDYDDQWGLKAIGFAATGRDGKDSLWPRSANPVIVAVVDTGIDYGHPELYGSLYANARDIPNNHVDDDGNGYIDDFLGWNFVDDSNDVRDLNGHGTFVAGIIAAATDNGMGMAGINPWARILPVKVNDFDGLGTSVAVSRGIAYAADMGARVINVSISGGTPTRLQAEAIRYAADKGALVVVAAGNEGQDAANLAPAAIPGAITVASTAADGSVSAFSNFGAPIDIAAPGDDILSLRAVQTDLMLFAADDYIPGSSIVGRQKLLYRTSGTSFSAPHVSGVASLIWSINPDLDAGQVRRMLLNSARDIGAPGVDPLSGHGLLDARAALAADPEFFIDALISGVGVVADGGAQAIQVLGTADADRMKRARVELGAGEEPAAWKTVIKSIRSPVVDGVLGNFAAAELAGSQVWILRIVVEHRDGSERENRFRIALGG